MQKTVTTFKRYVDFLKIDVGTRQEMCSQHHHYDACIWRKGTYKRVCSRLSSLFIFLSGLGETGRICFCDCSMQNQINVPAEFTLSLTTFPVNLAMALLKINGYLATVWLLELHLHVCRTHFVH